MPSAFNWDINITYRDTILPKSLNLWILAQLCYINSSISKISLTSSPLSMDFFFLLYIIYELLVTSSMNTCHPCTLVHINSSKSKISPTSSPLPMNFFFLLRIIHGPRTPSMNMWHPRTLVHGNYHLLRR